MKFAFRYILKRVIILAGKEDFGKDIIQYVYDKWGKKNAKEIVNLLISVANEGKEKLDELTAETKLKSKTKKTRKRNPARPL